MKETPVGNAAASFLGSGTIIAGKYRLESFIAKGGMGEVWVATNLMLESKVALKVLRRSLVDSPEASARLLREARAAARINHSNIVQVFDFGYVETGEPFIVMELLRGESLGDRLGRAIRIPAANAVEMFVPVVHALATAHAKGIVHRDLKPWNIFLAVDETNVEVPKIVDFGIAKVEAVHTQRVTVDGNVLGSPEYLSPEQALGEQEIDARADVWALCVTLYETITGKLPFSDPAYNRLLRRIVEDDAIPTTEHAGGDAELWAILRKGLEKQKENRWQTAAELGLALENWLEDRGVYTTGGTFRRGDLGTPPPPTAMSRTAGDIATAENPVVTRSRPRRKVKVGLLTAAVITLGVGAAAIALVVGRAPSNLAGAPSATELASSGSAGPTRRATAPVASAAQSSDPLPSASTVASIAPPPVSAIPGKASVATKRRPATNAGSVPAIPTEPNF